MLPESAPAETAVQVRYRMGRVALVAFVVAMLIVLGTSVQTYMEIQVREHVTPPFWRVARWPFVWWLGWVLLAPFCFEWAWRHPVRRRAGWMRPAAVLVLGSVGAFAVHVAYQVGTMYLPPFRMIHPDLADAVQYHTITSLYLNIFVYWFIVAAALGVKAYAAAQARALRAAQLEAELTTARLDALKMQLHPHFLFNTLHGISTLMYRDVATADRMVTRLSGLLRRTLDRSDAHEVTLRDELDLLEEYLAIEQLRFGEGLRVELDIERGLEDAMVPSFVFQPLVENAIKHGIAPSGNEGTITVRAWTEAGRLRLAVADDGPGLDAEAGALGGGVGLSNLHDRLRRLYGDAFAFDLCPADPHGLVVDLTLPLRRSSRGSGVHPGQTQAVPDALDRTG